MRELKAIKNMYLAMTICSIIVGAILLVLPEIGLNTMCKVYGILLVLYGIAKFSGYFAKDLFQLAFQFDFGLGIVSVILGLVLIFRTDHMIGILSFCIGIFMLVDATLKIQTSIEAKRFGINHWWMILGVAIFVVVIGVFLIFIPNRATNAITRVIGLGIVIDGIMNMVVVLKTVRTVKNAEKNIIDVDL